MSSDLPLGTKVGAQRWPYHHAHPDAWGRPWAGVVLALDDPRAWAETVAFPWPQPDPAAVTAHVTKCRARGWLSDGRVPVLWSFGDEERVHWESTDSLRPYWEDLAAWAAERWAAAQAREVA